MIKIDINSDSVKSALQALQETITLGPARTFEIEYNCKIISEDQFGLYGHIEFTEEKYATAFILRFGAND